MPAPDRPAGATPSQMRSFSALLLGGCSIGLAGILVRMSDTGPVASAFWRMALAAPALWFWVYVRGHAARPAQTAQTKTAMLWAGLFFAADLALWHFSIMFTTVANATLLANLAPVFVIVWGVLFKREQPPMPMLLSIGVSLSGAMMVIGPSFRISGTGLLGDALGVATALAYTGYMITIKHARASMDTIGLMARATTVSAIALLPIAIWFHLNDGHAFWPSSAQGWMVVLALALIAQVTGQSLIAYASAHLPVSVATTSLLIQPLVAALVAWILFAEALSPLQIVGAGLLLAGIYRLKGSGAETHTRRSSERRGGHEPSRD